MLEKKLTPKIAEKTQTEVAHAELSHRILILEVVPDERIVEEAWAEKLGVNRSAIRESLTRLLGEGLVYQGARGGFFVAEMSAAEIVELREVREILETAAVRLACGRATAGDLRALQETCDDFSTFVDKRYPTAAHEADFRFHHLLMAAAHNERLAQVYQRSRIPLFHRKVAKQRTQDDTFTQTDSEHRRILEALRKKDVDVAVARLREHLMRGMTEALSSDQASDETSATRRAPLAKKR